MNTYMKQRYAKRRQLAIDHLGGQCVKCGSTDELHFHHVDPSTKMTSIAKASSFSEDRFWTEVNKCELLCNTCHIAHHKVEHPHGDVKRYWRGCRCDLCFAAMAKYNHEYNLRRKEHLDSDI